MLPRGLRALVAMAALSLGGAAAWACSPKPGWSVPDPARAFDEAAVVVVARIASVRTEGPGSVATLSDVRMLKGEPVAEVRTAPTSACGLGSFEEGREYVLFLRRPDAGITFLDQPRERDADRVVEALRQAGRIR